MDLVPEDQGAKHKETIEGITKKDLSRLHHHLKEKMVTIFSTFIQREMRNEKKRVKEQQSKHHRSPPMISCGNLVSHGC
ncbi:hypothetical protein NC651_010344 [Populus alba x Populus x berolinensis]|nr:hypothetical protein NC651_010344 [Populus alba x Populus x berolinensis]